MTDQTERSPSVYEMLAVSVGRHGGKTAIVFGNDRISYDEFLTRVDTAARHLTGMGVGRGSTFAAYSGNRPELLYGYYAAAKLGAYFVPINPNMTASEVAYSFRHSGASILFHDDQVAEVARQAVPADRLFDLELLTRPAGMGQGSDDGRQSDAHDEFLIIYTSGSTGTPKAIVLDQDAQAGCSRSLAQMWGITDRDTTLVALPLGYLYGLSTAAANSLQTGGTAVVLRRFHPKDVLEAMVEHRVSVFHGVPTMYSMMLEYCEQRALAFDLSHMRVLISAGAPLPEELKRRFAAKFGKRLQNYYAMTECTPVFGTYADDSRPVPAAAIGRLAPGVTTEIRRPDGTRCAVGESGELFVRGPATMKRYMNDPALTAASLDGNLFRSGDLGMIDEAGYYYITGRAKDIIIRGGANISPSEVEHVLAVHSGVQDVAVIGAPDRIFGEVPVAYVVRRTGSNVSPDELVAHVEAGLADFKVPRSYVFVESIPLGKTGKVDKIELRRRWVERNA